MRDLWTKDSIEATKRSVKAELDRIGQEKGEEARLKHCLQRIAQLEPQQDLNSYLQRFILLVSALVHHARSGGLGKKTIQELAQLGEQILRGAGIKPGHQNLSFLYSELHSVLSDIHLAEGEFLPSLWERVLSQHLAQLPPEHAAHQHLGIGINAMRLGNSALAIQFFEQGLALEVTGRVNELLHLHLLKSLRLSGQLDFALAYASEHESKLQSTQCLQEWRWELACLGASREADFSELFALALPGMPLHLSNYPLELYFWIFAQHKKTLQQKLPVLTKLLVGLSDWKGSPLYLLARSLKQAYDSDIPFAKRLFLIKNEMEHIEQLRNVDQRLLVWASLGRWLHRSNYKPIAAILLYQYFSLSQKLSMGQSMDVLGIAEDLVAEYGSQTLRKPSTFSQSKP